MEPLTLPLSNALQLGCGNAPIAGAVNHDKVAHSTHVDVAHDLDTAPWPWGDSQFSEIVALDVVEHLKVDVNVWLDECWRILKPGGLLYVRVPHYTNINAYTDPTHRRFFTEHTFDYWDKSKELHKKYGFYYFAESDKWWSVRVVFCNGDIGFELTKVA